jgi:hypothetical protein
MNAAFRGMVFLVPLLSMIAWGQGEETRTHLSGTVVDQSGGGIKNSRVILYEIGRDDPTAETNPNAKGGEFEFTIRRNRSYRLVAESACMNSKVAKEVTVRSAGDTLLRPIVLAVKKCEEGQFAPSEPEGGMQVQPKDVPTGADLSRQEKSMNLPITRSAIDPRLLFPPIEFQAKVQGPRK